MTHVPEGWRLVPVNPTPEMVSAGREGRAAPFNPTRDLWRAMLDAAPAAPVQQAEPVEIVPQEWRNALQKLTFMARTSGGTPGPDEGLQAACADAEALLSKPVNHPPAAEVQRLRAEVEAQRADAERYRWLRENSHAIPYQDETDVWCVPYLVGNAGGHGGGVGESRHKSLDAAFDAARAARSKG